MIAIKDVSITIAEKKLFEHLTITINSGDRLGIIGANGAGKSTLLNAIIGTVSIDSGSIALSKEEHIEYLKQDFVCNEDDTVYSFLGYDEAVFSALAMVGLSDLPLDVSPLRLSGGQKTRLALAKIIIRKPTVLLLDEPTNHLDDETIQWFLRFLAKFRGTVIAVSHDRHFLNTMAMRILEIDPVNNRIECYEGNYDAYRAERAIRHASWQRHYEEQRKEEKRLHEWLAKKREQASVHPNPALGRMIRNKERYVEREIEAKRIAQPKDARTIYGGELSGEIHAHKLVIRMEGVEKYFADRAVLSGASLEIRGSARVRLSGANGSGKTTLLNIMRGAMVPDAGKIRIGNDIAIGYFDQEHAILDPKRTVLEEFQATERIGSAYQNARSILGRFLFSGDAVEKRVEDLSPGERVRLSFAKIMQQSNDLLILDEPTNHLDIPSREVIESAIIAYAGAVIVVSHDKYFLDTIGITEAYMVADGKIKKVVE